MLLLLLAMVVGLRALAAHGGYLSIFDAKYHQDVSPKGFWLSLFLVHAWNTMDTLTWNGVSWFVSVEFALCLVFPALLWLAEGKAVARLCPDRGGLAGLLALLFTSQHGLDITFHNGVLRGLSRFLHRRGHGGAVPPPQAARPDAGMGAFGACNCCCWRCWDMW